MEKYTKVRRKLVLLMLMIFVNINLQAQNSIDYLIRRQENTKGTEKADLLNQISRELRESDRMASLNYAKKAYEHSKSISYNAGQALALKNEGIIWFFLGKNDSAAFYYHNAYSLFQKMNDLSGQSACLNNLGLIEQETGNYKAAIEFYQKSITIDRKLSDEVSVATTLMNIGEVLLTQGESTQAIKIMEEAYVLFLKNGDITGIQNVLNNRAAAYDNLLKFDKAISDINEYIALAKKTGNRYYEARGFSNKALYLFHLGKINEAKASIDSSLSISNEADDGYGVYYTYLILADIYTYENKFDESNFYLQKVLKQAEQMDNKKLIASAMTSIGRNLLEMNEIDKAKGYFLKSLDISSHIGAAQEIMPNLYNLSIIEAVMRNFESADSLNELYLHKALELFGNDTAYRIIDTVITNNQDDKQNFKNMSNLITALFSIIAVFLLSLIAFKR